MPTGAQSRFSLARAHGVRAFPRFCLSTKAAVSAPRFDRPLATKLADTVQRASSRNTGRARFRLEADALVVEDTHGTSALDGGCCTNHSYIRCAMTKSNGSISPEVKRAARTPRLTRGGRTERRPTSPATHDWRFSNGPTFVQQPPCGAVARGGPRPLAAFSSRRPTASRGSRSGASRSRPGCAEWRAIHLGLHAPWRQLALAAIGKSRTEVG